MNLCGKCKHYQTSVCRRPFYGRNTLAPQGCFEAKKLTNYEIIKNMSIDEMAEFLAYEKRVCVHRVSAYKCYHCDDCTICFRKWLESEVEE